jgi:hypothetical protein
MFTSTAEIIDYVPIQKHVSWNTLKPFIDTTEDALKALVSEAVFSKLKSGVWENVWATEYTNLLKLTKRCAAFGILIEAFPSLRSQVSELGIQQSYSDSADLNRPAPVADAKLLLQSYQKQYYVASDRMLAFMEQNAHAFPEWTASPSYTEENYLYVRNTAEYQKFVHQVSSRKLYLALKPYLKNAERLFIESLLGTELSSDLKLFWLEAVKLNFKNLESLNTQYPVAVYGELIEQIKPVVAFHALATGSVYLAMSIEAEGIFLLEYQTHETRKANDYRVIEALRQSTGEQARLYEQRLRDFLASHAETLPKYPKTPETKKRAWQKDQDSKSIFWL